LKKYDDAKIWFLKVVKEKVDWPDAHYGLALACIRLGDHSEAAHHIEQAVHYTEGEISLQLQYTRALCHRKNESFARAEKEY
jgi:Tfp pilus assembly protein PilF